MVVTVLQYVTKKYMVLSLHVIVRKLNSMQACTLINMLTLICMCDVASY